jgi:hypothetical protein
LTSKLIDNSVISGQFEQSSSVKFTKFAIDTSDIWRQFEQSNFDKFTNLPIDSSDILGQFEKLNSDKFINWPMDASVISENWVQYLLHFSQHKSNTFKFGIINKNSSVILNMAQLYLNCSSWFKNDLIDMFNN